MNFAAEKINDQDQRRRFQEMGFFFLAECRAFVGLGFRRQLLSSVLQTKYWRSASTCHLPYISIE